MDRVEATASGIVGDALEAAGQHVPMPCGRRHSCGKCGVYVSGDVEPAGPRETELLSRSRSVPDPLPGFQYRLACLARFRGEAMVIASSISDVAVADVGADLVSYDGEEPGGCGIAVDVGTTTVTVLLLRLGDGQRLADTSRLNYQTSHGADVLSRIDAASRVGVAALKTIIVDELEAMFADVLDRAQVAPEQVTQITITGNTTMLHLLTGRPVAALGVAPFTPDTLFGYTEPAQKYFPGLVNAQVYFPPGISTYVGPDIVCGLLATGVGSQDRAPGLLVDIGTNGEMALAAGGRLWCCSTAAGPAFEGGEISEGMPALPGAIDEVWADQGRIGYSTVRGKRARGICGTGLTSAVHTYLATGVLDDSGYLDVDDDAGLEIDGSHIHLSQADVRKLQLAKAAVAAGIDTLVDSAGIDADQVDRLHLAGAFGSYLQAGPAAGIGLIPQVLAGRTDPAGNSALTGAVLLTRNRGARRVAEARASAAEEVQLATSPVFMTRYVDQMSFGTDDDDDIE